MWSYHSPTAESTDLKASYQWPAVNNHYVTVPCECRHQCLFLSFLGRHDCEKMTGNMQDFRFTCSTMLLACQAIYARFCMTSSKRCSSVSRYDILDCSRTQYTTYSEFFTEVTGDEWDCATVCWHAVCVPGPLPSSREPGVSTCNVFRRIHTAHVWPERVVLTREANVWKTQSFLTFLPCFIYEYRTTGQTTAHFWQVTCCAKNPPHSSVSAQLWIIMRKLRSAHHQIYPWYPAFNSYCA